MSSTLRRLVGKNLPRVAKDLLEYTNYTIMPAIQEIQRVMQLHFENTAEFRTNGMGELRSSAGTSSFASFLTYVATSGFGFLVDMSHYPERKGPTKTRKVYLVVLVSSTSGTSHYQLYNSTDAEAVTDSDFTHDSVTATKYTVGPLPVGSSAGQLQTDEKLYEFQGRNDDGGEARAYQVDLVVRYE